MTTPLDALRERLDEALLERDYEPETREDILDAVMPALEPWARAQQHKADQAIEEHETELCPEDMGCKEYIAALRAEIDRLARAQQEQLADCVALGLQQEHIQRQRAEAAEAEIARLTIALTLCPQCDQTPERGHAPDCPQDRGASKG